jgi:hypothetical protein
MKFRDFEYALAIESCASFGQDRAAVVAFESSLLVALADGAGGTPSLRVAAG